MCATIVLYVGINGGRPVPVEVGTEDTPANVIVIMGLSGNNITVKFNNGILDHDLLLADQGVCAEAILNLIEIRIVDVFVSPYQTGVVWSDNVIDVYGIYRCQLQDISSLEDDLISISMGFTHTVALTRNGRILKGGEGTDGQLDFPPEFGDSVSIKNITAGHHYTLIQLLNGRVLEFGFCEIHMDRTEATTVVARSIGHFFELEHLNDGTVRAIGDFAPVVSPPPEVRDLRFKQIAAGYSFAMGLTMDGKVVSWGERTPVIDVEGEIVRIAAGGCNAVVLLKDGTIHTWGSNNFGQYDFLK